MTEQFPEPESQDILEPGEYARRIEAYLCRKNDGHLIRVVGPAFARVCRWAEQGVPLKVAMRGIDRRFERYYAGGERRRPLRIEFCEADVLDAFDAWRRAVGMPSSAADAQGGGDERVEVSHEERRTSVPAHLQRLQLRISGLLTSARLPEPLRACLDRTVRELDTLAQSARAFRGETRNAALEALRRLDEQLMDTALASVDDAVRGDAEREAGAELRPFEGRLQDHAWRQAMARATRQALREKLGLPTLTIE